MTDNQPASLTLWHLLEGKKSMIDLSLVLTLIKVSGPRLVIYILLGFCLKINKIEGTNFSHKTLIIA